MVTISLLIPWLICFLIWLFLIRALRAAQSQLTSKNVNTSFRNDRKQDTYFRITLMIVCVLTVYMICRSGHLFEVIYIFITPLLSIEKQIFFNQIRMKVFCISNLMLTINHGANFYIYSINPKFRLTLKLYLTYYFRRCRLKRRRAFTLFHLRRKKTNDSLDGLSIQNDFHRSMMMTSPNVIHVNLGHSPNQSHHQNNVNGNFTTNSIRTPQRYLKQFINPHSVHENSDKSYVWREIEQRLKNNRRNPYRWGFCCVSVRLSLFLWIYLMFLEEPYSSYQIRPIVHNKRKDSMSFSYVSPRIIETYYSWGIDRRRIILFRANLLASLRLIRSSVIIDMPFG